MIGNLSSTTKAGQSTRTVAYSPFNTPTLITQGSKSNWIIYGPNQERLKHTDSNGRSTKYIGGNYEEVTKGGITQKIHYIGHFVLYVQTGGTTPTNKHEYLHRDHLGSIVAISNATVNSATDITWQSNGAWGERRFQQWDGPLDNALIPSTTARGFTDHEHMDAVGLIHMNGRVYDPELGRFMSADPFVQAPYNSQSYNRYSYVFNNPLSYTDPSGFVSMSMVGYIYADYGGRRSDDSSPPEQTDPTIGRRSDCPPGATCMSGDAAYQWSQTWYASNSHNQQWAYAGGSAYNIANFWGKVAFDLAAGGIGSHLPTLPDGVVNFGVGLGNTVSFGVGGWLSEQVNGAGSVNTNSRAYMMGSIAGVFTPGGWIKGGATASTKAVALVNPTYNSLKGMGIAGFQAHHILPQYLGKMLGYSTRQMGNHPATLISQLAHTGAGNPSSMHKAISNYLPYEKGVTYTAQEIRVGLRSAYDDIGRPDLFKSIEHLIK